MTRYEAPNGTKVFWGEAQVRQLKNPTTINTSVQWNDQDADSFYRRYAEGDTSPQRKGSYIVSYGVEQQGGPAYLEVKKWLEERGDKREPSKQEVYDWCIVHYGSKAPPIAAPDGTKTNPIPVKDTRYRHGHVMEVKGRWYMNDLSPGSRARSGFPVDNENPADTGPDYKEVVAKVRARVEAVELPSEGGELAHRLTQLVKDLSAIVGKER